jgi:hypothetical protein
MDHEHSPEENGQEPLGNVADGYDLPAPPEALKAATAFLIVVLPDGTAAAYSDVNMPLDLERESTLNDMYSAAAQVQRDVMIMTMTNQVVNNTINGLMMAMAQQAEMAKNAKIAAKLQAKGIHLPN